jgi:hypothetical protein
VAASSTEELTSPIIISNGDNTDPITIHSNSDNYYSTITEEDSSVEGVEINLRKGGVFRLALKKKQSSAEEEEEDDENQSLLTRLP